jgi:predicted amidohydrolase YtcJ
MTEVDLILNNALVVTMNEDYQIHSSGAVAVRGDRIVAVGNESDIM